MTNKESYFADLHILMRAILMAQRTPAAGFADTGIEKAVAKSAPAGKNSVPSVAKNLFTPLETCLLFLMGCNPRLMNYLCAFVISTLVVSALQIHLFLQNKAKFRKSQMNTTFFITRNYGIKDTWWNGKKQSQTNPKQSQKACIFAGL